MSKTYFTTSIGWLDACCLEVFPIDAQRVTEDEDGYCMDVEADTQEGAEISLFHTTRRDVDKPVLTFRMPLESLVLLGRWAATLEDESRLR